MDIDKFKVIKGGGKKTFHPEYIFKSAYITNTRLMGVVGMKIYWETASEEKYVQFFHLDWEEYGIDGFESLGNPEEEEIRILESRIMGGLGGKLVEINEREAIYLLKEAEKISIKNNEPLPDYLDEYEFLLNRELDFSNDEIQSLWKKMCEVIETEIQLINYFLMRAIGNDVQGQSYLSSPDIDDFVPTGKPSTLIKNIVEFSHSENKKNYYRCESVIDFDNGYQLLISHIGVIKAPSGICIDYAEIKNQMKITTIEAAFQLKKPEYILIYEVEEFADLLEILDKLKPNAMQNVHQSGFLLTEFNPSNDHVKDAQYYLNGDIYAVYYVTTGNQLAIGTFHEENLKEIKKAFKKKELKEILDFAGEFKADSPLIYEFVQSGLDDFYEFIDEE